jgi:hypothetical protein
MEILHRIFCMYPEALSQPMSPLKRDYPLHLACGQLHRAPVSVILLLAQAYTDAVHMEDLDGFLPIHPLLYKPQRAATLHEVHTLLDIHPHSQTFAFVFGTPLLDCKATKQDVLTFLVRRFPNKILDLQLGERGIHQDCPPTPGSRKSYSLMTLDHAQLLTPLLPQLTTLTVTPHQWNPRAFVHLMSDLYQQNQVIQLDLHLPPNLLL